MQCSGHWCCYNIWYVTTHGAVIIHVALLTSQHVTTIYPAIAECRCWMQVNCANMPHDCVNNQPCNNGSRCFQPCGIMQHAVSFP
jgi:hypothetical protein